MQLSYRRIRRYLVLPLKAAEKHVTSSHVRFTFTTSYDDVTWFTSEEDLQHFGTEHGVQGWKLYRPDNYIKEASDVYLSAEERQLIWFMW